MTGRNIGRLLLMSCSITLMMHMYWNAIYRAPSPQRQLIDHSIPIVPFDSIRHIRSVDDRTAENVTRMHHYAGNTNTTGVSECLDPRRLAGKIYVNSNISLATTYEQIRQLNVIPLQFGHRKTSSCHGEQDVAFIIPLRGRDAQFRLLLHHIYPILRRQRIAFSIYAVTQGGSGLFNRAKLFNIGIEKSLEDRNYDCFIFHDTDLLLEDDRCLYRCHEKHPLHLSKYVDVLSYKAMNYTLECPPPGFNNTLQLFGGVSAMTKQQLRDVNGFSNKYWGWGGEDDDVNLRLWRKGYNVSHVSGEHCSYTMVKHGRESWNPTNSDRLKLLYDSTNRMESDGLNSLRYRTISVERNPLYVNITVSIGDGSKDARYVNKFLRNACNETLGG